MNKTAITTILTALAASQALMGADYSATEGAWKIQIEEATRKLTLSHDGTPLLNGVYAAATYNYRGETADHTISSLDASAMPEITVEDLNDEFGQGKTYILTYRADGDEAIMEHRLSFYPSLPYMLAQVRVAAPAGKTVESRSLKALAVSEPSTPYRCIKPHGMGTL